MGRARKERPAGLIGEIGERIEALRKERGWRAEELAVKSGLGLSTIIRLEAGAAEPGIATLANVAGAFDLSGADLLATCASWMATPVKSKSRRTAIG